MIFPTVYNCLSQNEFALSDYKIVPIRYEDRLDIMKWRNEQMYHLSQDKPLTKESQENYYTKTLFHLFDNDKPGHDAMDKYQQKFGIPGLYLNLSKDISDSIRDHGHAITKKVLTQLLPK